MKNQRTEKKMPPIAIEGDLRELSMQTVRRCCEYLDWVQERISAGFEYVSSSDAARTLRIQHVLARKDLSATGVVGRPKLGFPAIELRDAIKRLLAWDRPMPAVLCGVGNLGHALLGYQGFARQNFKIVAGFEMNPKIIGTSQKGVRIYPLSEAGSVIERTKAKIAILAVPNAAAQACADILIGAGIVGFWNFTISRLAVPAGIVVQQENILSGLSELTYSVAMLNGAETKGEHGV